METSSKYNLVQLQELKICYQGEKNRYRVFSLKLGYVLAAVDYLNSLNNDDIKDLAIRMGGLENCVESLKLNPLV